MFQQIFFSELDSDTEWFPKQKVEYARRKLQGYNPAHITKYVFTIL